MRRNKRFREEIFGCLGIPGGTEPKFQGVSLRIFGAREGHPDLFHFHVRLIDAPGVMGGFEVRLAAFLQFWRVVLHPAVVA